MFWKLKRTAPEAKVAWKLKSKGSLAVASSRLRALLPCEYLRAEGFPCEIFDPRRQDRYEVVVFQKSFRQEDVELARRLRRHGTRIVFDLDANHFHVTEDDAPSQERLDRLRALVDMASAVTFPSTEISKLIEHDRKLLVPDLVEPFKAPAKRAASSELRVVWFGNAGLKHPPWGMIDVHALVPSLEKVHEKVPLRLSVISNNRPWFKEYFGNAPFATSYYPWSLKSFGKSFSKQDVCILPFNVNPVTRCKSNNRAVLSLLMGIPVIADRIPSYEELCDFILFSDWEENLLRYATDEELRRSHLARAEVYLDEHHSKEVILSKWRNLFRGLLSEPPEPAVERRTSDLGRSAPREPEHWKNKVTSTT